MKWLLTTFKADISPNERSEYVLRFDQETRIQEPDRVVFITEDDESYSVDTGVLRCSISKNSFSVLRDLTIKQNDEWTIVSPQGLNFVVEDVWRQRALADFSKEKVNEQPAASYTAEIEEQTPLRAVFKISGPAFGVAGELLHYTFRITFQAGSEPELRPCSPGSTPTTPRPTANLSRRLSGLHRISWRYLMGRGRRLGNR